ncbi:MAG: hypothetical protein QXI33_01000 [Candidatus Pacearchaeota archaeon]
MKSERSSVHEVMREEIDARFPEIHNNSINKINIGKNLRRGLAALSITIGLAGSISGCNSYIADKLSQIYPKQEYAIIDRNHVSPLHNYLIYIDEIVNGLAVSGITYSLGMITLAISKR